MKRHLLFALLLLMAATMQAQTKANAADSFSLKIRYLFASDLSQAHEDYDGEYEVGEKYLVASPALDGYRPEPDTVRGRMPDHDVVDTVLYLANTCTVTTKSQPEAGGTTTGGGTYDYNEEVTVTAEANEGYAFSSWMLEDEVVATQTSYTFHVTGDCTLTAVFEAQGGETHTITISPLIVHGTISVSPTGPVEVGATVTITATPDDGYVLDRIMAYNKDDVSQTVELDGLTFVMPDFDVMLSAVFELEGGLPVIHDDITAPASICAGDVLDLTVPSVSDADEQGWQMSSTAAFDEIVAYTGQALDATYNGWSLRYMASNATGTVYSNVVTITVRDMSGYTLVGDQSLCSGEEASYRVTGFQPAGLTVSWTVSDATAIVDATGFTAKVLWGASGTQQVNVVIEDETSGCSTTLSIEVTVRSYISEGDVNDIVAKKHDGVAYLLIYPNPKDTYKYQWYKDGEAIEGATGQYYYPANGLADGVYQVYISYNADAQGNLFCGAFSPSFTVGTAKADFMVYPNPAHCNDGLVVVNNTDRDAMLTIYTVDGRLLLSQTMAAGQETVTQPLAQGVYVMHLSNGLETKVEKVVIQ